MIETKQIKYTKGYKYMLEEDAWFYTGIVLDRDFTTRWVIHQKEGWMMIKKCFGYDGPSGPTLDDKTNMRGALAHDGLYYLFRHGFPVKYRKIADGMLKRMMIEDGACKVRASYYEWAVSKFAQSSADPKNARKILTAP